MESYEIVEGGYYFSFSGSRHCLNSKGCVYKIEKIHKTDQLYYFCAIYDMKGNKLVYQFYPSEYILPYLHRRVQPRNFHE